MPDIYIATAIILGILPFVFAFLMAILSPEYKMFRFFFMVMIFLSVVVQLEFIRGETKAAYPTLSGLIWSVEYTMMLVVFVAVLFGVIKVLADVHTFVKRLRAK